MITIDNLIKHEMIGIKTKIIGSSNLQLEGINGTIVDETKSMFKIKTGKGIKSIPKSINIWSFNVKGHEKIIEGSKITKRPYERIGAKE